MKKAPVAIAALALVVVACSPADQDAADTPQQMSHIHGIGVNTKDGAVFAGTHHGLFRIHEGTATRVSEEQDFMGFTVAGPDHFLASGHPGPGQGGQPSVGLIESTDTGRTWRARSLGGRADFHGLVYRHGRAYGFNSHDGALMVSRDLTSWEVLSRPSILDFAVSPTSAEHLIATTRTGLVQSGDGGRTFEPVDGAPLMLLVDWGRDGTLAGLASDGVVYTASNLSGDWTQQGSIGGPPEALTVESAKAIYAATGGTVWKSVDGGNSFDSLHD